MNDNDALNNLNKIANDYDEISNESIIFENTNDAIQPVDELQSTDIINSRDVNCSQSITENIISINEMEMETVDGNDYYVSLEDQIKTYRENNRAKS